MKTAILYYSMSGNTAYAARIMADILAADLIPLMPKKAFPDSGFKKFFWGGKSALMGDKPELEPYPFDPAAYDLIVLGGPVWAGTFAPPLRTFIEKHREELITIRLAVFFCCSGGPGKVLDKFRSFLKEVHPEQELILIDPKDKPAADTAEKINAFCSALM